VQELLRRTAGELAAAGCDSPRLDAELLLGEAMGCTRARLLIDGDAPVPPDAARRFAALAARRREREPVAYLLGRRGFRRLDLHVDPRVLIPRPETETLVEAALGLPPGARVVDVATGSGAVALALADERPDLDVAGTDISAAALEVARGNAARLGLPVPMRQADLLAGAGGPHDAAVANLPYVAAADLPGLAPELAREPPFALDGGPDGLGLIRRLVLEAAAVPFVALEVGQGQAPAVAALLAPTHPQVETRRDLAGIERVVVGRQR
jgi:release factor glutamine methyltransferase